jgi:hypothetical protein
MSNGPSQRSSGFASHSYNNSVRNSPYRRGNFGSGTAPRNFSHSNSVPSAARRAANPGSGWHSFGNSNSNGRNMPTSARGFGNTRTGGSSFPNSNRGGALGAGPNFARADGQWHGFGNSGNASLNRRTPGNSNFASNRGMNMHSSAMGFNSNRFSGNMPRSGNSGFSSFSSRPRFSTRFSGSSFSPGSGGSRFGGSAFRGPGFSNSRSGAGVFGFFGRGTRFGGNSRSFAGRSFGSTWGFNRFGGRGFGRRGFGFGRFGFGYPWYGYGSSWNFAFSFGYGAPYCGPAWDFWGPAWAWSGGYCGPSLYDPWGWSGVGYFGYPSNGYDASFDDSGYSDWYSAQDDGRSN